MGHRHRPIWRSVAETHLASTRRADHHLFLTFGFRRLGTRLNAQYTAIAAVMAPPPVLEMFGPGQRHHIPTSIHGRVFQPFIAIEPHETVESFSGAALRAVMDIPRCIQWVHRYLRRKVRRKALQTSTGTAARPPRTGLLLGPSPSVLAIHADSSLSRLTAPTLLPGTASSRTRPRRRREHRLHRRR